MALIISTVIWGQRFAHSYYPEFLHENEQKIMLDGKYYSHDLMLEKALNFIDENAQKPFFLYFSPTIPHADLDIMGEAMTEYEGEFCETPFGGSRDGYKSQQIRVRRMRRWLLIWIKVWV